MGVRHILYGVNGSPYSIKVRAILRYRRIPFDWVQTFPYTEPERWHVRPLVLPIFERGDDGSQHVDSTPLAQVLEAEDGGARSIYPDDAGQRFLALLLEDFADEWLTKPIFWYRWAREPDISHAREWLSREVNPGASRAELDAFGAAFQERQISRMPLVGCTPENEPLIEASFLATMDAMTASTEDGHWLFGSRPSVADVALYGMLRQLATDPTPRDILLARQPALRDWLDRTDDASGIEGTWSPTDAPLGDTVIALLQHSGAVYAPFLLANEAAVAAGESEFTVALEGHDFSQTSFPYQVKCLTILRREWGDLNGEVRAQLTPLLEDAGWLPAIQGNS